MNAAPHRREPRHILFILGGFTVEQLETKKNFWRREYYGVPVWMLAILVGAIYLVTFTGKMADQDMLSIIAIMFSIGLVLYELGERIPLWKDYLGGGSMLAFLGAAALEFYGILPAKYCESITYFYDDYGFQTIFISLLIVSSVLGVNRKQLIKAFGGYIPAIFGGIILSAILGIGAAALCGVDIKAAVTLYVLPIMGGGNGELLKDPETYAMAGDKAEKPKVGLYEAAGDLLLTCAMYAIARLLSKTIPAIGSISFHLYVYLILMTAVLNVIPVKLKVGVKQCSDFLTKPLMCYCMVGIGIAFTDLGELAAALTWQTLVISAAVVAGAAIGAGFVGTLFGFNFVESGVTAGLCMANRGGSGDLKVLGACKRMQLMSYAQISSRIGGAIILTIGSIVFSVLA